MLEIKNLLKQVSLPNGKILTIARVDALKVNSGEQMLLVGPSGSGKTTLLHMIAGLLIPTSGMVKCDDVEINQLSSKECDQWRAQNVGYIFQKLNLLNGLTVGENIRIAAHFAGQKDRAKILKDAKELLEIVGLADKLHMKPNRLSVGEQQRVAVARAVINKPKLILADEPTASLDQENAGIILDLLKKLCSENNSKLLISTHDPIVMGKFGHCYEMRMQREAAV
ncbi:ABC transporter ATP-binding protein [Anaerosinus massiliensis]|uniref:ABC transporter ATP-binding protein n=1 Tax=Massilibacillus massiliensis TaxID=1806837 RepID=UPI0018FE2015|nr:ABC transporter ATP-binding protein [Massilibacillus massiliensis]